MLTAQRTEGAHADMKPIEQDRGRPLLGRRGFFAGAAGLVAGAGLSAAALAGRDDGKDDRGASRTEEDIALRDQDLKFIGTEETFSTPELMKLNSINNDHIDFLTEIGLADLGARRIGDMDKGGLN